MTSDKIDEVWSLSHKNKKCGSALAAQRLLHFAAEPPSQKTYPGCYVMLLIVIEAVLFWYQKRYVSTRQMCVIFQEK